jgi:ferredoxin-NADP reductase
LVRLPTYFLISRLLLMVATPSKDDVLTPLLRLSPRLAAWLPRSRFAEQTVRDAAMVATSLFRYRPVATTYAPSASTAPPRRTTTPPDQPAEQPPSTLRVLAITDDAEGTRTLHLERPAGFTFEAGQFLTLLLPVPSPAGGAGSSSLPLQPLLRRSYSLCSAPHEAGPLRLGVRRVPDGLGSSFLHGLTVATEEGASPLLLAYRGPSGSFVYRPSAVVGPHRLVLLAGGSGITPLLSIAKTALACRDDATVVVFYAVRTLAQAAYLDELRALVASSRSRLTLHVFAEDGPLPNDGSASRGRIPPALLVETLHQGDTVYLCGPDAMMETLGEVCHEAGLPPDRVHRERFFTPQRAPVPARRERVHLLLHGVELPADPQKTLLETALAAGLPVPFSCTMGGCGECKARLEAGRVSMAEPNCLSAAERADGAILPCISHPLTDVHLSYPDRDSSFPPREGQESSR